LGFGVVALGPNPQTPNPQSPIPNPQLTSFFILKYIKKINK